MDSEMGKLVRYDAMCNAIAAAHKVDEVKEIRDQSIALEHYARQARNTEAELQACQIRLRAERKAGELLAKMEKAKAGRHPKIDNTMSSINKGPPTLDQLGLSPKQSSDWQKLAAIPKKQFEAALNDPTGRPTTSGIIRAHAEPKRNPVAPEALWLWGRLKDFERDGLLDKAPSTVMKSMTDEMLDDVHTLAPKVAAWLKRIGATNAAKDAA